MDYMGGLSAESLAAMNVVSGVAHGFGEQTSFTTSKWAEPPEERDKDKRGGRATRIGVSSLGCTFTSAELDVLMSAHGAKSALLPNDRRVLPNGVEDIRRDPRRFNVYDAQRRMEEINAIPTANRPDHFADKRMREVVATANKAAKLNPKAEIAEAKNVDLTKLRARLVKFSTASEKLRGTYENLAQERTEQGATVRAIGDLRRSTPLNQTGTETNVTDVSKATVSRWRNGTKRPQPNSERVLSDLIYVVKRLEDYYSNDEIRLWLYARHPQLEGQRAIDLIHDGEVVEIFRVLDRLDADGYL